MCSLACAVTSSYREGNYLQLRSGQATLSVNITNITTALPYSQHYHQQSHKRLARRSSFRPRCTKVMAILTSRSS